MHVKLAGVGTVGACVSSEDCFHLEREPRRPRTRRGITKRSCLLQGWVLVSSLCLLTFRDLRPNNARREASVHTSAATPRGLVYLQVFYFSPRLS